MAVKTNAGRRPASQRGVIDAANAEVAACDLAERLSGPGVRRGKEWFFLCPLHDDHDPSLRVDPEKGLWFCDPCGVGGDAVRLARLAWGHDRDDVAAAELLMGFGHDLPERPPSWFARQERQAPLRDRLGRRRIEHVALLVFRLCWMPWLRRLPDDVMEEAAGSAWRDSLWLAERIYGGRRGA